MSALLRGITSNHVGDVYCSNCFHSYEKVCNNHEYCYVEMPNEDNRVLKYNYGENPLKALFIIYADLEYLLEKMHSCQNIFEKVYKEKKTKHTLSGYSIFTSCLVNPAKNKLDFTKVRRGLYGKLL